MPSELVQRLAKIQTSETAELEDLSKFSLQELAEMKIDFGNTHRGKTYRQMWLEHQGWVKWFLAHYANSTKENHRKVVLYFLTGDRKVRAGRSHSPECRSTSRKQSSTAFASQDSSQVEGISSTNNQPCSRNARLGDSRPDRRDGSTERVGVRHGILESTGSRCSGDRRCADQYHLHRTYMANRMDHMERMLNQIVAHLNKPADQ